MTIHSAFLKYFDETCKHGSIRMAARNLFVASSAINRQILKVEDKLGIKLFERSASGITLTAAGELLALHISRTLADAERTLAEIESLKHRHQVRITIVGQDSVIARFLPPALLELHAAFPEAATSFQSASGTQVVEQLLGGSADIAVAFDPEPNPAVRVVDSRQLPVSAVMTGAHPLAGRTRVSIADCEDFPIVLPDQTWPLRKLIDEAFDNAGLRPAIITSSNSVEFLRTMVDRELGIGFQTSVGIETAVENGELVLVPLANPGPVMQTFALCAHVDRVATPFMQRALELLSARLEEYAGRSLA